MKKTKNGKGTKDRIISVRVPGHIIDILKGFDINVSEVVNEALRTKALEEIGKSRKK